MVRTSAQNSLLQTSFHSIKDHPAQAIEIVRDAMRDQTAPLLQGDAGHRLRTLQDYFDMFRITRHNVLGKEEVILKNRCGFTLKPGLDAGLVLENCSDFRIDLSHLQGGFENSDRPKFFLSLHGCRHFEVIGGSLSDLRNVALFEDCHDFSLRDLVVSRAEGYGATLFNCSMFQVSNCTFLECLASGIYCIGACTRGLVENNLCHDGKGYYNWDAGIHINHCTSAMTAEMLPELSHEDARILDKTLKPTELFFLGNHCTLNRAQGIYCEGAIHCWFENNYLWRNNKEGICFDWGSSANVFVRNNVMLNGQRAGLSPEEIKADFIEHFPILPDGSSSCKLPGVSIDNGACNLIHDNKIQNNYGGGVKMVRSGLGNVISNNRLLANALGRNEHFSKFHAVLMLGMGAGDVEFDPDSANLDFYPSEGNTITRNVVKIAAPDQIAAHDTVSERNTQSHNILV